MNKNKIMEILHKHSGTVDNHGATGIYFADFDNVVEDLHNLDNWISVDELPKEHNKYYLVYLNKPNPQTKMRTERMWYDDMYGFERADGFNVTYWQPLPASPQKDK